jgi:hypothetical protein
LNRFPAAGNASLLKKNMKHFTLLAALMLATLSVDAQSAAPALESYEGTYQARIDTTSQFVIRNEKGKWMLRIVGQGEVAMTKVGEDQLRPDRVRPKAIIQFVRDEQGRPKQFKWMQSVPAGKLVRVTSSSSDSAHQTTAHPLARYAGNYLFSFDRSRGAQVRLEEDHLTIRFTNEGKHVLTQERPGRFYFGDEDMRLTLDFVEQPDGKIDHINFARTGSIVFIKATQALPQSPEVVYGFLRPNGFTRADTLRGKLSALRSCYDVLFYDLDVTVVPESRTVRGTNTIRFRAVTSFDQLQVDLFSNMRIEEIMYQGRALSFTREWNAVFLRFPHQLERGSVHEITIRYAGQPQQPDGARLAGGIFWLQDKEGNPWIETVTQGAGASLWWPCKDHLSDKPDSMRIRVTVPPGLTDISNGTLRSKTVLKTGETKFEWYVRYPITTYCVAMNIGKYVPLTDRFIRDGDTLLLNYYSKPYDVAQARRLFSQVKPMLGVFERYFGKYPFSRDGLTVMESIYPMEHQGAVTFGSMFNPFNSDTYDSADILRTMWHEVAHEWWGNHVTIDDYADMWIHEAFATYAEWLAYKELQGEAAAAKYMRDQVAANREPIIGTYEVNDFRLGDMYTKGVRMLHTLQQVMQDDARWFALLRDIQQEWSSQPITTVELVNYINRKTNTDYTSFFNQYLRYASLPELQVKFEKRNKETWMSYRWKADEPGFAMPVRVTTSPNQYTFLHPRTNWQEINLHTLKPKDFKADTEHFYISVKTIK